MASVYNSRSQMRRVNLVSGTARNLSQRMTWHAAGAIVTFAAVQIWLVGAAVDAGAPRPIAIIALMALIMLAIPFARRIERRWHQLGREALPSPALTLRFRRDVRRLWLLALFLPACWIGAAMLAVPALAAL